MTNEIENSRPRLLAWLDLETTGLDPKEDGILELAFRLTEFDYPYADADVPIVAGQYLLRNAARQRLLDGGCSSFIENMHAKSGLTDALKDESRTTSESTMNDDLLRLSASWPGVGVDKSKLTDEERVALKDSMVVLAGNSVDFDRGFLRVHFPDFAARVSHRVFDVSALSMAARSLGMPRLPKSERHRASMDVEESILQARMISKYFAHLSVRPSR